MQSHSLPSTRWIRLAGWLAAAVLACAAGPTGAFRLSMAPTGTYADMGFGQRIAVGSDLDGDGHTDLLVLANDPPPRLYLLRGGLDADDIVDAVYDVTPEGGALRCGMAAGGDFDGDGYGDVVVVTSRTSTVPAQLQLFPGGEPPSTIAVSSYDLPTSFSGVNVTLPIAFVPDLAGDGLDDILIGFPNAVTSGLALLFPGRSNRTLQPSRTFSGADDLGLARNESFATSIAGLGDVNGDGFNDIALSAPTRSDLQTISSEGAVYVYFGGPGYDSVPDLVLMGEAAGDHFGTLAGRGDFDGDGQGDILASSWQHDGVVADAGRLYVYRGGVGIDAVCDQVIDGDNYRDRLGYTVASLGDLDADGYDDVGTAIATSGMVVYHGGSMSSAWRSQLIHAESNIDSYAAALSGLGDFDGDGFGDFAVGAPAHSQSVARSGRVYVFRGGTDGFVQLSTSSLSTSFSQRFTVRLGITRTGHDNDPAPQLATAEFWVYFDPALIQWVETRTAPGLVDWTSMTQVVVEGDLFISMTGPSPIAVLPLTTDLVELEFASLEQVGQTEVLPTLIQRLYDPDGLPLTHGQALAGIVSVTGPSGAPPHTVARMRYLDNVPNPFNPATRLRFEVGAPGLVAVRIVAANGRLVRAYELGWLETGSHELVWDGRGAGGLPVASGVYQVRICSDAGCDGGPVALVR